MNIFDIFSKQNKLDCYETIEEMPIYNWFQIHSTSNLKHILKVKKDITATDLIILEGTFAKLYDEFLDKFGVNETLQKILELKRDIRVLELDMFLNDDFSRETFIDIKKLELESLTKEKTETNYNEVKSYVEKFMGFRLDSKIVTVSEYYTYLELLKQQQNQANVSR